MPMPMPMPMLTPMLTPADGERARHPGR
jgi:hypothetical protein